MMDRFPGEHKKIKREPFGEGVSDDVLDDVPQKGPTKRSVYKLEDSPHIDPR